jgi:biotin carboxyl carrier protein
MRTYLIDQEKNEFIVDLIHSHIHSAELVEYHFRTIDQDNNEVNREIVFIRKLADQYFASSDSIQWRKLARQDSPTIMLNVEKVYKLYRGYKPSSLSQGGEGGLLTQMPGKVVKILVGVGEKVQKGQTLLILEAMKMENEIKSGIDGVVKAIHVKQGDALENGVLLMEVE